MKTVSKAQKPAAKAGKTPNQITAGEYRNELHYLRRIMEKTNLAPAEISDYLKRMDEMRASDIRGAAKTHSERVQHKSPEQHGTAFLAALRHTMGDDESEATITIPLEIPIHAFDWVNLVAISNRLGWTEEETIGELVMRHLEGLPSHLEEDQKHNEELAARWAYLDKAKSGKNLAAGKAT